MSRRRTVPAQDHHRRRIMGAVIAGLTVMGGVGVLSWTRGGTDGSPPRGYSTQGFSAAPEAFDLPTLTGDGHVRLSDHRGRPVVVNFFASWCSYCNQELPGFVQVARQSHGRVDFIAVQTQDTGDGEAMARRFDLAGEGFALAHDIGGTPPNQLWAAFGGQGLPVTAFYDAQGKLVDFAGGMLARSELESLLAKNFDVTVTATDAEAGSAPHTGGRPDTGGRPAGPVDGPAPAGTADDTGGPERPIG